MTPSSLPFLASLMRAAETLARAAVWVGGALTIASVLVVCVDVLARKFLGWTVGGADELSSYAFAISTTWSLAFAALQRANVRVDVIYQYLPVRVSAVLDWLALVALGTFMGFLTYYAYDVVAASVAQGSRANTPLATPLVVPQGLWYLGLVFMCVVLALMLVRASVALVTGDIATVKALAGVRSAQEEAAEEAASGERMVRGA
ncbi:TRAP transporter small permease subunit [Aquabacter spiritensis]|uniref:TRAP transporter small permease protein n=1 Tax=Aquabacter spiritensis TaxID=933073 RepID=A0A4R3M3E2_9HYPH|nr:TRAP transporter small permease [Aquabacter spiritensis]TCT07754.1 TRAP-type mannitol/chloroaromatic compound transport system permease small subunit [Aquabacter spiritensis]